MQPYMGMGIKAPKSANNAYAKDGVDGFVNFLKGEFKSSTNAGSSIHGVIDMPLDVKNSPEGIKKRKARLRSKDRADLPITNKAIESGDQENWVLDRFSGGDENDLIDIYHGGNSTYIKSMLQRSRGYSTNQNMLQNGTVSRAGMMVHSQLPEATIKYSGKGDGAPAVLQGKIPRKYLVANDIVDEFSIPEKHFDKIINPTIHEEGTPLYDKLYRKWNGQ